jgi:ArsR family transcriptional regulator, arsenate/arsenite/antimonite-responsive transcriptional repressor
MQDMLMVFKALSEETRLRIIKLLEEGELCVCDIVAALDLSQPKISFHLNVLKEAGLVTDRKQGKWTHYRLATGDMFRRMLLLSVTEKIDKQIMAADLERLNLFIGAKPLKAKVVELKQNSGGRCGRC